MQTILNGPHLARAVAPTPPSRAQRARLTCPCGRCLSGRGSRGQQPPGGSSLRKSFHTLPGAALGVTGVMKGTILIAGILLSFAFTTVQGRCETGDQPDTPAVTLDDGVNFIAADGQSKLTVQGWIMVDAAILDGESDVKNYVGDPLDDDIELREARLMLNATLFDFIDGVFEYNFSDAEPNFKDVYIGISEIPYLGKVKLGHMKEPFSLEELTSLSHITFMERGLPNAFAPGRNLGFQIQNNAMDQRLTWAIGGFLELTDLDEGYDEDKLFDVAARVTGLPLWEEEGRRLLHLGISYLHTSAEEGASITYKASPESYLAEVSFVDTGPIASDDADIINPEMAIVYGPFSLQAEYMHAFVDDADGSNPHFSGYYIFGSYFLTGEHRRYEKKKAIFGRVKPLADFNPFKGGWGALEIALRYSFIDLEDGTLRNEDLEDWTLGLNWYFNKHIKLMGNYIYSHLDDVGDSNILQTRLQIYF